MNSNIRGQNSVGSDEAAHNELPHLNQKYMCFCFKALNIIFYLAIAESGSSQLSTLMIETPGDLV